MNSISNSSEFKSRLSAKIQGYNALSQSHIDLATLLLEENLTNTCLIIGHMSVKAMLKAVYLKEDDRGVFTDMNQISFEELLSFARDHDVIDLDTEQFLSKVFFLSSLENIPLASNLDKNHVMMIMRRVEESLRALSERMEEDVHMWR
ncbi:hypothetical protein [Paenibacillus sp.]|uniref:hypothetical protein n=1 Tax=Paenibacillus sp. TaxID=58172 RepID=UPI0028A624C2|nr:hypothetical protein [Paenibacillus sp.]